MISEEDLRKTAKNLLGSLIPDSFPFDSLADRLSSAEIVSDIALSAYGFFMWCLDHYGTKITWTNVVNSDKAVDGYVGAAEKYREDMPVLLLNANVYVTRIMSNVADLDTCFKQLEGMTFPYVLYVLFAGSGQHDIVERYKAEAEEQLRRYPSTLDLLPETYRNVGKEVLNADIE